MRDLQHTHPTTVFVLRACYNDDAIDLVAVGGEHSVEVVQVTDEDCHVVATFHIGTRVTAIAWSSATVSPASSDSWHIELAVAAADFGLHLLTKSPSEQGSVFPFGGGLSGHHGKINDMAFCGGRSEDSARYVATVSDDKMLMVWDLQPNIDIPSGIPAGSTPSPPPRPQPTAYAIPFPHPLTSVCSHPSTSKEFLVADSRGSIFLTDWRSDPQDIRHTGLRNSSLIELVEPLTLSRSSTGISSPQCSASIDWRRDTTDVIGAAYGPRFAIWDIAQLRGGKPSNSGTSFADGGHQFRWCPTYPEYFAISSQLPTKGAVIHLHNTNYIHAQPTPFTIFPRPHLVRSFAFLALPGIPRIAAAVGRSLSIFSIGDES